MFKNKIANPVFIKFLLKKGYINIFMEFSFIKYICKKLISFFLQDNLHFFKLREITNFSGVGKIMLILNIHY